MGYNIPILDEPDATMLTFVDRLNAACDATQSLVCVGLDVDDGRVRDAVVRATGVRGDRVTERFNRDIVDATADLACAYKFNMAFYEAQKLAGLRALDRTIKHIRKTAPHTIIIGDNKLGDIGSTALAYARAMFDVLGFDAVTINAWGGHDTVEPWLEYTDKGSFIWCRGSNPGSAEFQDLEVIAPDGSKEVLYLRMARRSCEWNKDGNLGLVAGATAPAELKSIRQVCPDMPLLIPGVGAQGGDLEATVRYGVDAAGRNAIINSSRNIIYASSGPDYADAARRATERLRDAINATLDDMGLGWQ